MTQCMDVSEAKEDIGEGLSMDVTNSQLCLSRKGTTWLVTWTEWMIEMEIEILIFVFSIKKMYSVLLPHSATSCMSILMTWLLFLTIYISCLDFPMRSLTFWKGSLLLRCYVCVTSCPQMFDCKHSYLPYQEAWIQFVSTLLSFNQNQNGAWNMCELFI